MKNSKGVIVSIIVVFVLFCSLSNCMGCNDGPEGDGKNTCENCGRSPVVADGMCKSCWKGYLEWLADGGGN